MIKRLYPTQYIQSIFDLDIEKLKEILENTINRYYDLEKLVINR